jgi:hypothetical protein
MLDRGEILRASNLSVGIWQNYYNLDAKLLNHYFAISTAAWDAPQTALACP